MRALHAIAVVAILLISFGVTTLLLSPPPSAPIDSTGMSARISFPQAAGVSNRPQAHVNSSAYRSAAFGFLSSSNTGQNFRQRFLGKFGKVYGMLLS